MKKITTGSKNSKGMSTIKVLVLLSERKNCKKFFFENKIGGALETASPITEGTVAIQYIPKLDMIGVAESGYNFISGSDFDKSAILEKEEARAYLRKYGIDLFKEFKIEEVK